MEVCKQGDTHKVQLGPGRPEQIAMAMQCIQEKLTENSIDPADPALPDFCHLKPIPLNLAVKHSRDLVTMDHITQSMTAQTTFQTTTSNSAAITAFWSLICSYLQSTINDSSLVIGGLGRLMTRAALTRWRGDEKRLTIAYFVFVLCMRIFVRSATGQAMPWFVIMAIEDGLSIMSFVVGLLYLHHTDGISRALFRKRVGASEGSSGTSQGETAAPPSPARPEDMKLFFYAM